MKKVVILAQSFDTETGELNAEAREEIVDLETNEIFKDCKSLTDVVETYQNFWNRLPTIQRELVLVQSIKIKE